MEQNEIIKLNQIIEKAKRQGKDDVVTIASNMLIDRTECLTLCAKKFSTILEPEVMVKDYAEETIKKVSADGRIKKFLKKPQELVDQIVEQAKQPLSMVACRGEYFVETDLIKVIIFSPIKINGALGWAARFKLQQNLGLLFKISVEQTKTETIFVFKPKDRA